MPNNRQLAELNLAFINGSDIIPWLAITGTTHATATVGVYEFTAATLDEPRLFAFTFHDTDTTIVSDTNALLQRYAVLSPFINTVLTDFTQQNIHYLMTGAGLGAVYATLATHQYGLHGTVVFHSPGCNEIIAAAFASNLPDLIPTQRFINFPPSPLEALGTHSGNSINLHLPLMTTTLATQLQFSINEFREDGEPALYSVTQSDGSLTIVATGATHSFTDTTTMNSIIVQQGELVVEAASKNNYFLYPTTSCIVNGDFGGRIVFAGATHNHTLGGIAIFDGNEHYNVIASSITLRGDLPGPIVISDAADPHSAQITVASINNYGIGVVEPSSLYPIPSEVEDYRPSIAASKNRQTDLLAHTTTFMPQIIHYTNRTDLGQFVVTLPGDSVIAGNGLQTLTGRLDPFTGLQDSDGDDVGVIYIGTFNNTALTEAPIRNIKLARYLVNSINVATTGPYLVITWQELNPIINRVVTFVATFDSNLNPVGPIQNINANSALTSDFRTSISGNITAVGYTGSIGPFTTIDLRLINTRTNTLIGSLSPGVLTGGGVLFFARQLGIGFVTPNDPNTAQILAAAVSLNNVVQQLEFYDANLNFLGATPLPDNVDETWPVNIYPLSASFYIILFVRENVLHLAIRDRASHHTLVDTPINSNSELKKYLTSIKSAITQQMLRPKLPTLPIIRSNSHTYATLWPQLSFMHKQDLSSFALTYGSSQDHIHGDLVISFVIRDAVDNSAIHWQRIWGSSAFDISEIPTITIPTIEPVNPGLPNTTISIPIATLTTTSSISLSVSASGSRSKTTSATNTASITVTASRSSAGSISLSVTPPPTPSVLAQPSASSDSNSPGGGSGNENNKGKDSNLALPLAIGAIATAAGAATCCAVLACRHQWQRRENHATAATTGYRSVLILPQHGRESTPTDSINLLELARLAYPMTADNIIELIAQLTTEHNEETLGRLTAAIIEQIHRQLARTDISPNLQPLIDALNGVHARLQTLETQGNGAHVATQRAALEALLRNLPQLGLIIEDAGNPSLTPPSAQVIAQQIEALATTDEPQQLQRLRTDILQQVRLLVAQEGTLTTEQLQPLVNAITSLHQRLHAVEQPTDNLHIATQRAALEALLAELPTAGLIVEHEPAVMDGTATLSMRVQAHEHTEDRSAASEPRLRLTATTNTPRSQDGLTAREVQDIARKEVNALLGPVLASNAKRRQAEELRTRSTVRGNVQPPARASIHDATLRAAAAAVLDNQHITDESSDSDTSGFSSTPVPVAIAEHVITPAATHHTNHLSPSIPASQHPSSSTTPQPSALPKHSASASTNTAQQNASSGYIASGISQQFIHVVDHAGPNLGLALIFHHWGKTLYHTVADWWYGPELLRDHAWCSQMAIAIDLLSTQLFKPTAKLEKREFSRTKALLHTIRQCAQQLGTTPFSFQPTIESINNLSELAAALQQAQRAWQQQLQMSFSDFSHLTKQTKTELALALQTIERELAIVWCKQEYQQLQIIRDDYLQRHPFAVKTAAELENHTLAELKAIVQQLTSERNPRARATRTLASIAVKLADIDWTLIHTSDSDLSHAEVLQSIQSNTLATPSLAEFVAAMGQSNQRQFASYYSKLATQPTAPSTITTKAKQASISIRSVLPVTFYAPPPIADTATNHNHTLVVQRQPRLTME